MVHSLRKIGSVPNLLMRRAPQWMQEGVKVFHVGFSFALEQQSQANEITQRPKRPRHRRGGNIAPSAGQVEDAGGFAFFVVVVGSHSWPFSASRAKRSVVGLMRSQAT